MLNLEKVNKLEQNKTRGFHVCGVCYCEFIKQPGSIYNMKVGDKIFHMCSYSCYRKAQIWKESKKNG